MANEESFNTDDDGTPLNSPIRAQAEQVDNDGGDAEHVEEAAGSGHAPVQTSATQRDSDAAPAAPGAYDAIASAKAAAAAAARVDAEHLFSAIIASDDGGEVREANGGEGDAVRDESDDDGNDEIIRSAPIELKSSAAHASAAAAAPLRSGAAASATKYANVDDVAQSGGSSGVTENSSQAPVANSLSSSQNTPKKISMVKSS